MASTTNAYNNNNRRDEKYFLFFLHRVVSFFLILVTHRQQVDWSEWRVPAVSSQQQLPFISFDIFDNLMGFRREFQKQALTQSLRLNDWKWILLFFLSCCCFSIVDVHSMECYHIWKTRKKWIAKAELLQETRWIDRVKKNGKRVALKVDR